MNKWIDKQDLLSSEEISEEKLHQALQCAVKQVKKNVIEHHNLFPDSNSIENNYIFGKNVEWTTGFWSGEVWLAYENACDEQDKSLFRNEGEREIDSFDYRIDHLIDVDHHDMGFLYSPSCVAGYQLIKSETGKAAAIKAADHLMTRYQPVGEFIQAWGSLGTPGNYRLIIDCLLNVPLLYWATKVTGDNKYKEVADKHTATTMKYIIREDNSTYHALFFDPKTGVFDHGATSQGYKDSSAWARGQAWGIYGSALAYKNTGKKEYIDSFRRTSEYYLSHLPADLIPFWDLIFGSGDEDVESRDSSAAAVAICGFLEMAKYLESSEKDFYVSVAKKIMHSLVKHYQVTDFSMSNGQLLHGTYAKSSPYNTVQDRGVDECVIWGDYFFMEALNRLTHSDWELYW